jgi:D-apionolactonase
MSAAQSVLYYGTAQPVAPARRLKAGPWSALLIDGALHDIRYNGLEVIRAVSFLVRDKDWGTCRPDFERIDIEETGGGFRVAYDARCANPEGHVLRYTLAMACAAEGALTFRCDVTAHTDFLAARCGFCVLHPIDDVAGAPARVEHGDGRRENASFPALIDPWQPFKDIASIEHDLPNGLTVRCAFTGDVFEMEDQRNWSDASFKTYSRPLELPWPYTLEKGAAFTQTVALDVSGAHQATGNIEALHEAPPLEIAIRATDPARPEARPETMPAIGVAISTRDAQAALANLPLLAELGPQQLTLSFDPLAGDGIAELEQFAQLQRESGVAAVLEFALPGVEAPRAELARLATQIDHAGLTLAGIVVSPSVHRQSNPPGSVSPPCPPLDEVYREARRAFPTLRLGGGMLSYFTELNRKRPPLDRVDWVTHATCPIVHAADDRSVMQTLEAIPHITRSCRALIGEQSYAIGPLSIGMRQNPYGSRVMPNPAGERVAMAADDPRQRALFGAAWLAGYAAALEGARIETLTLGALTGPRGLADVEGGTLARYPVLHVAKALARMAGAVRLRVTGGGDGTGIACLAARHADGAMALVLANLTSEPHDVRLEFDEAMHTSLRATCLDEGTLSGHPGAPEPWTLTPGVPVTLRPFACVLASSHAALS